MPRKLKTKLKQREFYCVSCRGRVICDSKNIGVALFKNKRMIGGVAPALRAECPKCQTNLTKFIKHCDTKKFIDKYGEFHI